jgi:hypothetical protein
LLQLLHVDELEPAHAAHAFALPDAARVLTDYLDEVSGLNISQIMARSICLFVFLANASDADTDFKNCEFPV